MGQTLKKNLKSDLKYALPLPCASIFRAAVIDAAHFNSFFIGDFNMAGNDQESTTPSSDQESTTVPSTEPTTAESDLDGLSPAELIAKVREAQAKVKNANSEAASYRTKLRAAEKADEERVNATLSEIEKAKLAETNALAKATALEAKLVKAASLSRLKAANIIDPEIAYAFLAGQIETVDGEPQNLDTLIADFVAARPAMVGKTAPAAPVLPNTKPTNPVSSHHLDTSKMSPMEKLRHAYGGK